MTALMNTVNNDNTPPLSIRRIGGTRLELTWPPALALGVCQITAESLRRVCPCAACREIPHQAYSLEAPTATPAKKLSTLNVVEHNKNDMCTLVKIWPIGDYALGIQFKDGHQTGIFTFALLQRLCAESLKL